MAAKINYGDNIYYLETLIKTIKNGLSLNIDADYFREKTLEDIQFLGSALSEIYASLRANSHLIKKTDYLRSLLRATRDYLSLIEDILAGKLPLAPELSVGFPKLKISKAEETRDIEDIKAFIENRGQADADSDLLSTEEYQFLLTQADDTDGQN